MHRARILALAILVAACGGTATVTPAPTVAPPSSSAAGTAAPPVAASPASSASATGEAPVLSEGMLGGGTYRLAAQVLGPSFPAVEFTVPEGWHGGEWFVLRQKRSGGDVPAVAVQFWDVRDVFAHPCRWEGTAHDPGPTAADLAGALEDVPMRGATSPVETTLGGRPALSMRWSVPEDIAVEGDAQFPDCDATADGNRDFLSWEGAGGGTRFHQGPGQVDHLWILDLDGARLVVDAFEMPGADEVAVDEMHAVVESIRFVQAD